jgi:hypothetical protein
MAGTHAPAVCQAAYALIEQSSPREPPKTAEAEWKSWSKTHRRYPDDVGTCLARAGDCKAAWVAFQRAAPRFDPKMPPAEYRKEFERRVRSCR